MMFSPKSWIKDSHARNGQTDVHTLQDFKDVKLRSGKNLSINISLITITLAKKWPQWHFLSGAAGLSHFSLISLKKKPYYLTSF